MIDVAHAFWYSSNCIKQAPKGVVKICLLKTGVYLIQALCNVFVPFAGTEFMLA